MSELAKRTLFAVVAAPVALWIVLAGGAPLAALLAIVCALGAWEFFRIVRGTGANPLSDAGIALAGLLPLAVHAAYLGVFTVSPAVAALIVLLLLGASIWLRGVDGRPLAAVGTTLLGVIYTGGMLSFGYAIRYHDTVRGYDDVAAHHLGIAGLALRVPPGGALLVFPLVVTWASDIGAYFVGRSIGGRKLIPSVSPGKTVSGAVGGLFASMLVSWLYARYVLVPVASLGFTPGGALLFGALISVAAQVGDLFESLIKREGGVKDSSRIIPGHGGILDRFDSLIFVLPVAYLLLGVVAAPGLPVTTRGIAILGSTGSIGTTALRVIERHPERFHVAALTAFTNGALLAKQAARHSPGFVGLVGDGDACAPGWSQGEGCLIEAATRPDVDVVINSVVGAAGLGATIAALEAGKRVALANKESLVMGGALVADAARVGGGELVPVDSEHSAIVQCIAGRPASEVRRLILTASGGPFRDWSAERLAGATLADALRHPTWQMGRKITIDSATLANKALEVIEAHYLFGVPYDRISVVVHPQSVVHSFVEFVDGSVLAQMGVPSMELPILYALTYPDRVDDTGVPSYDPVTLSPLTFEAVRDDAFPCLGLGIQAGRDGGAAPAVFNAANEAAVALFLDGTIRLSDIARAIGGALEQLRGLPAGSRDEILAADAQARHYVQELFQC